MNIIKYPELGCATLLPDIQTDPVTVGSDVGRPEIVVINPSNDPENEPENDVELIITVSPFAMLPILIIVGGTLLMFKKS